MKLFTIFLASLFLAAGIVGAEDTVLRDPVGEALLQLSEKEQKKLEAGKVVFVSRTEKGEEGADAGIGWAIGIINTTPEKVWAVLEKYEEYPEYMPRVTSVESYELEGESPYFGLVFTLKILFTDMSYHIKQINDREALTITWSKDSEKADDFTKNDGQWVLRPHAEGKTLAFYTVDVRTQRKIPKAVQDFLLKRDLPNVIEALKERVEAVGQ